MGPAAAAAHQRSVNDNSREPSGKLGTSLESSQIAVGSEHSFLEGVLGVFRIAEKTERCLIEGPTVAPKECFKRHLVAGDRMAQQYRLIRISFLSIYAYFVRLAHLFPPNDTCD
jgi:hypothetical protein